MFLYDLLSVRSRLTAISKLSTTQYHITFKVKDDKRNQYWRRVEMKVADHVYVLVFLDGEDYYDVHLHDYLTKIAIDSFPQNWPLWDLHLIKYPTRASTGTMVLRLKHALGDGFSLIGALFQGFRQADNPSLPLTLPTANPIKEDISGCRKLAKAPSMCVNTVHDFGFGLLKSKMLADNPSPIRSGATGVEFRPIMVSTVEFSLDHIKLIKKTLGATVNDVITGTIFYGVHLYIQAVAGTAAKSAAMTAMVLLNTRVIGNYPTTIKEMTKPNTESPWGNHFSFMHIAIPSCRDLEAADPLGFILQAKKIIKNKRNSLGIYLIARLLDMIRRRKGPERRLCKFASILTTTACSRSYTSVTKELKPVDNKCTWSPGEDGPPGASNKERSGHRGADVR